MKTKMWTTRRAAGVLVALVFAGGLRADEAEEKAIRSLQQVGGQIQRDEKTPGRPVTSVLLQFDPSYVPFGALRACKQIRSLSISNTRIDDADYRGLGELKQLQSLTIIHSSMGDAAMKELRNLGQLQELSLYGT